MPGWTANGMSASSRYDHSGSYASSCSWGSGPKCSGRRHTPRKPRSSMHRGALRPSASLGVGDRQRRDAERCSGSCDAVLRDPVVHRAAQRERGLALGDALGSSGRTWGRARRRRCGRPPCRRCAAPAWCRRAARRARRTGAGSARARPWRRCGPRCGSRPGRRTRSGSGRPPAAPAAPRRRNSGAAARPTRGVGSIDVTVGVEHPRSGSRAQVVACRASRSLRAAPPGRAGGR